MENLYGGRYQLEEKLGVGGMSEVWRAYDHSLKRQVAIKILLPDLVDNPEFEARFLQEGEIMARIQSPYAVSLFDRGRAEGRPYMAMEYVDGPTLEEIIKEKGKDSLPLLDGVLQAVATAHRGGILHRDLKPSNVLVGSDGRPQVIDFGVADVGGETWDKPGSIIGTAHYISPEQVEGREATEASDIYALGVILYQILAGKTPFEGSPEQILAQKTLQDPPRPAPSRGVSRDQEAIAIWALQRDPEKRPKDAEEMRKALFTKSSSPKKKAPSKKRLPKTLWLLPLLVLPLLFFFLPQGETMPNVVGMTQNKAEEVLKSQNIDYLLLEVPDSREGVVIETDPPAGEDVGRQTVQVMVGSGLQKITIPDLPKNLQKAEDLLQKIGFETKILRRSNKAAKNQVFGSTPSSGSEVDPGSTVTILVSLGKQLPQLPSFIGLQINQARSLAENKGLVVSSRGVESAAAAGKVISQKPEEGARSDSVLLVYSLGQAPAPITLPSVVGLSETKATRELEGLGLSVSVRSQTTSLPAEEGIVLRQKPGEGKSLFPGDTITIWVGSLQES